MRIGSQSMGPNIQDSIKSATVGTANKEALTVNQPKNNQSSVMVQRGGTNQPTTKNKKEEERLDTAVKEKVQEAVESINDFLDIQKKSSKFIFHDGLDKYYVRLVDSETEEVIKEIPPEKLLNAFYEMQKLAGMIVDEKI